MADGHYETESSIDRRISATVLAMTRALRAEIEPLKKQAAAAEAEIQTLRAEIAELRERLTGLAGGSRKGDTDTRTNTD